MRTNKRRNLTSSQWACIAIEAEDIVNAIKTEAKERQVEGGKNKGLELIPKAKKTHTSEKVAELFNTNEKYVREAEKYKTEMPEVFESIKQGEKTITEVKKEQKIEKRKAEIDKIKKSIEKEPLPIDGLFDVVVLDPPWPYGREYNPITSRVANPYPEMKTEEIEKIKIPIKENAVVFL